MEHRNQSHPRNPSDPNRLELTVPVIAWAQFLVLVTVIDKTETRDISLSHILHGTQPFNWGCAGWLILALNSVALCFFTIAILCSNPNVKEDWLRESNERNIKRFGELGMHVWVWSFLGLLAYFNYGLAILAAVTALVLMVWLACSEAATRRRH